MNCKNFTLLSAILFTFWWFQVVAQPQAIPFASDRWDMTNADVVTEEYQGKQSVLIKSGNIFLTGDPILNGDIEFDINFSDQRGFPGIAFRMVDPDNYEDIYIRPHKSGKPDAIQYTPVFNGVSAWQLYHGPGYTDTLTLAPGTWHHIKLSIEGKTASFYFDNRPEPSLKVTDLKREPVSGQICLESLLAPVHYAGFNYTKRDFTPELMKEPESGKNDEIVNTWFVSEAVGKDLFFGKTMINDSIKNSLTWKKVISEPTGLVNLAQYAVMDMNNAKITAVARCEINSDMETVKLFTFGFSDEVRLYFNDRLMYTGADAYLSRDFQFSGVIGYYDAVLLPLKKGKNEVWMVVTDYFGGWGVQAKLENAEIKEIVLAPEILNKYVGEYELQPGFSITVTREEGQLLAQGTGQNKIKIYAESPTLFFVKVIDAKMEFLPDDNGNFSRLILYQNGQKYEAKRKE